MVSLVSLQREFHLVFLCKQLPVWQKYLKALNKFSPFFAFTRIPTSHDRPVFGSHSIDRWRLLRWYGNPYAGKHSN